MKTKKSEPLLTRDVQRDKDYDWMPEAMQLAAQCWCDKETKNMTMEVVLAKAVARRIAAWMDTAAQAYSNAGYYRGLLVKCGEAIGEQSYICDDGTKSQDVLCAKVPELVAALTSSASQTAAGARENEELEHYYGLFEEIRRAVAPITPTDASKKEIIDTVKRLVEQQKPCPWIRTAERAPTKEDAPTGLVLAVTLGDGDFITMPWETISASYKNWDFWMPIPPVPEGQQT